VVPGDIWTCDTLSTERAPVTKRHEISELIDPMDTSYLGYTQDPLGLSETIDSSYVIEDFSDSTTEMTAYPLIEFEDSDETTHDDKSMRNPLYHKEVNYLYEYTNSQEQLPLSLMQEYKDIMDSHYKWLNEVMNRLHVYKELSAAISSSLSMPTRDATTVNPTQTITIFSTTHNRKNISLNYLMQSYTERNELHNSEPTEMVESNEPQMDSVTSTTASKESALELLINSLDSDNNIIRINDNLGNKRYLTIDRYKALAHQLTPRTVSVVACTRNVRLPNRTDCNRYYICEPKTATVAEYTCPPYTAFNMYSRICDVESAKTCGNRSPVNEIFFEHAENKSTTIDDEEPFEKRLCRELGKIKDPTSDSHYYICYSMPNSEDIKSIRMTCPNTLIFCQSKKVCTTRRLCDALP